MPTWHQRERHRVPVSASAPALMRATRELTWVEVPVFRTLMLVRFRRGGAADRAVLEWMTSDGFDLLETGDAHLVVGAIVSTGLRPATVTTARDPDGFRRFDQPGHVKIAFDFRVADDTLTTETRVLATDARSRRRFTAYWALIRPFSGLIRHVWLRAIRRRADRPVPVTGDRPAPPAARSRRPSHRYGTS